MLKLSRFVSTCLALGMPCILWTPAASGQATIELSGVVRDLKKSHPDFDVVPVGGPGHYAGNIGRDLSTDGRPVYAGGGFKVATEWTNSGSQPIPPHLFAEPFDPGAIQVGQGASLQPGALVDTWDSSLGPYAPGGPAPAINTGAPMPVILVPTNLGPSLGDVVLNNNTISSNLHCNNLDIKGTVVIDGQLTILCDGEFRLSTNADLELAPGATLELYARGGVLILPRTNLNANTANAALVTIYNLGEIEVRIAQPDATVYAMIISPNAAMRVMPQSHFYGYFIGEYLETQPLGGFHLDTSLAPPPPADASGVLIDDIPGTIAAFSDGGITSADTFDEWYNDKLGVTLAREHSITMTDNGSGVYEYFNSAFYPIDHQLYGNQGDPHNFYFTFEIAADFQYDSCVGQFLEFRGADDAWIFVDGKLGIDLGGVMPATEQILEMDRLGLTDGQTYSIHLFYAHRGSPEPGFNFRTNIDLSNGEAMATASLPCD